MESNAGLGLSAILALVSFYFMRQTAIKNSGQEWGELKSDVKHIKNDIEDIKNSIGESSRATTAALEKEIAERKEEDRRLEKLFYDHINNHNS